MWGWTDQEQNNPGGPIENPTYVGMDRLSEWHGRSLARKPHVCGDGPTICHQQGEKLEKTPRMWGWTAFRALGHETYSENPTYVGMDRATKTRLPTCWPKTPRMWGWTVTLPDFEAMADENPTYVGMDR